MDIKNLTTFIHVAELGSFTKAAEVLGFPSPRFPSRSNSWKTSWTPSSLSGSTAPCP